jgi:uncharacterized membrane protein YkvA (DUF1232 family)
VDGDSTRIKGSSLCLTSNMVRSESAFAAGWRQRTQRLQKEAHVFYFLFKHPGTPWYAKSVAALAAGYVLSPIQLIPNFIPVIGSVDDLAVLFVGIKLLQKITPVEVLSQCRQRADAAEALRIEEKRWMASAVAPIVIATVWVLAAITASALMAAYIYH